MGETFTRLPRENLVVWRLLVVYRRGRFIPDGENVSNLGVVANKVPLVERMVENESSQMNTWFSNLQPP